MRPDRCGFEQRGCGREYGVWGVAMKKEGDRVEDEEDGGMGDKEGVLVSAAY